MRPRPPILGRLILRVLPLGARRAEYEADLAELFARRVAAYGVRLARRRYVHDAVSLVWRRHSTSRTILGQARPASRDAMRWSLHHVTNDIRFAMRLFRRQAGVFTLAVLGLATAIGINTAAFTAFVAGSLRPLGVAAPDRLARLVSTSGLPIDLADADFLALRERATLLDVEASRFDQTRRLLRPDTGATDSVRTKFVSGGLFATFGGRASSGRVLQPGDDQPGVTAVAVLSHVFWTSRLGADPSVVGSTVLVDGVPFVVVGVADRAFTGPFEDPPAMWLPLQAIAILGGSAPLSPSSQMHVEVHASLAGTAARRGAEAEASAIIAAIRASRGEKPLEVRLGPGRRPLSPKVAMQTAILMGIFGLVLVLACTNVANLLLSSAASRRHEIAARLALGATRGRIVRQLLTESMLLGVVAGGLGLVAAVWALPILARMAGGSSATDLSPDIRVYTFAALISMIAGVAAGLAPARHGAHGDLLTPLKSATGGTGQAAGSWLRSTFVGIQAAASMALLALAVLFGRVVLHTATVDVGLDPSRFLSVRMASPQGWREGAAFLDRAAERARGLPGIEAVALANAGPFDGTFVRDSATRDGRAVVVHEIAATADYAQTLDLTIIRGRFYTPDEVRTGAPVAVISEGLARSLWGATDPLGQPLQKAFQRPSNGPPKQIIGVVKDVVMNWRHADAGMIYVPLLKRDEGMARLVIRVSGNADTQARPIQEAIAALDPNVRLSWTLTAEQFAMQLTAGRVLATFTSILGALALLLAVVGMFGVTAFVVSQRQREVGVRMAFGATGADILNLLLRDSLRPVVIGLVCGLAIAVGSGFGFASVLYGVRPYDPAALAVATLVLIAAAVTAVAGPARRASRVDPSRVLRLS